MKKTALLLLFALISISAFAQLKLNNQAQFFKDSIPEFYKPIKEFAVERWGEDEELLVRLEINTQSEALMTYMMEYASDDSDRVTWTMLRYCEEPDLIGTTEHLLMIKFDWFMIIKTLKED